MKKVIVSLFIFIFLMFGYTADSAVSNTNKCGCCGKGEYVHQTDGTMSLTCMCDKNNSGLVEMCPYCGNCVTIHCKCASSTPGDQGSQGNQGGHTCSFAATCSMTHCSIKVCSCGAHQNGATCGGGCSYTTCTHCSGTYCSRCNNHSCSCNFSQTCPKVHCHVKICSMCGKHQSGNCGGDHVYSSSKCSMAHCGGTICSVIGCYVHQNGTCGGDHVKGNWIESSGLHKLTCSVSGCGIGLEYHSPAWNAPNSNHTSTCKSCNLTYTHSPSWGVYGASGGSHVSYCTVSVGGSRCSASLSHSPSWSGYFKADGGGEASSAKHIRRCNVCGITSGDHWFSSLDKWYKLDDKSHRRTCSICSLTQTLSHNFNSRESIEDDIEKHYKICYTCIDRNTDYNYKVLEKHVDEDTNGRGDGICDLCYKELWEVIISNSEPTNKDITVTVRMFSDYNDTIELPVKMIGLYGEEIVEADGVYTISENTDSESGKYYIFRFETPDRDVKVEITNISKDIYGRVFISPDIATKGDVTLKLVVSKEGIQKTIDLKFENDDEWSEDVLSLTRPVSNNGKYVFKAKDSLGNEKDFVVNVNNIVSGFGSVTTTFDAFPNGYIFTDILVNVTQAWVPNDAIISFLEGSIYKVDGNQKIIIGQDNVKDIVNKIQITDELGNIVTDSILESGIYYVRVAIGGPNVFADEGTYMVEINSTAVKRANDTLITLAGKNRIEVIVQSLNDLT